MKTICYFEKDHRQPGPKSTTYFTASLNEEQKANFYRLLYDGWEEEYEKLCDQIFVANDRIYITHNSYEEVKNVLERIGFVVILFYTPAGYRDSWNRKQKQARSLGNYITKILNKEFNIPGDVMCAQAAGRIHCFWVGADNTLKTTSVNNTMAYLHEKNIYDALIDILGTHIVDF